MPVESRCEDSWSGDTLGPAGRPSLACRGGSLRVERGPLSTRRAWQGRGGFSRGFSPQPAWTQGPGPPSHLESSR